MSNKKQVFQTNVRLSAALRTRVDQYCRQNEQNYNLTSLISAALVEKLDREVQRPTCAEPGSNRVECNEQEDQNHWRET